MDPGSAAHHTASAARCAASGERQLRRSGGFRFGLGQASVTGKKSIIKPKESSKGDETE